MYQTKREPISRPQRRQSRDQAAPPAAIRVADVSLDRTSRLVVVADRRIHLTPSEFDLLATLMEAPGRAFTRGELVAQLRGEAYDGDERTIDVHVRNLRAKIEANSRNPRYVETVYGIGYRFAPPQYL